MSEEQCSSFCYACLFVNLLMFLLDLSHIMRERERERERGTFF